MEEYSVMASASEEGEAESRRRRPRDLLRRLGSVGNCCEESAEANGADSDEIELSLGLSLSLGGCFGPDSNPNPNLNLNPKGKIKLSRSSSLASFSPFAAAAGDNASSLVRTCSLPTETEEERRKRKEMESLKRLEAKRKRLERRNSIKSTGSARDTAEDSDPIPIPIPISISFNGCRRHHRILTSRPPEWPFPPISQASSVGSQGSCSFSSAADFEIKAPAAAAAAAAAEGNDSSFEIQPLPDNINHKIAAMPPAAPTRTETNCSTGQENPIRTLSGRTNSVRKNIMEDMPCVSTKGDGPNGRRIEGFLFKFEKVEDLRIVCVCHGSFLTPAEFVKHAGGGDVAHPLKHIVVNPSSSSLS